MTEAEWLASEDPQAMTAWAKSPNVDTVNKSAQCEANRRLSDRKLRLWVEACRHVAGVSDYFDIYNAGLRLAVAYWCSGDGLPLSHADRAALLRCIAGNPWWPVEPAWATFAVSGERGRHPVVDWLTPTVLSLAHAAYDERAGRDCDDAECRGRGKWADAAGDACECGACHGTGRIDDGSLDPVRLAILADALEEAGCDSEDLLAHLRSPGPHVRGCWAVDMILGKE